MLDELTHTYTVEELSNQILGALESAFSNDVWVHGTIVNLNRGRNGHVYFDLCQLPDEPGQPPIASISVALFKTNKDVVNALLKRTGNIRMEDGIRARIRGVVTFYPRTGRLQLRMTSIDPSFTLGSMAADRDRVLRKLAADGTLDRNKLAPLAAAPQRIGLITAASSAAYHDFVTELENSGLAWQLACVDVQVQGVRAEGAICAALDTLATRDVDVIVLIRGGGSRTDLMAFDSENVARAIARSSVPVFTGIGHEIDRSIADEAAYASYKTPTACAHALVALVRSYLAACETVWRRIARAAVAHTARDAAIVDALAQRAAAATSQLLTVHDQHARHLGRRVQAEANHALSRAAARLDQHAIATVAGAHRRVRQAQTTVGALATNLPTRARRGVGRADRTIDGLAARARAHDPARVLARGFTLTRRPDGSVVRSAAAVGAGDALVTVFADGRAHATVTSVDLTDSTDLGQD